MSHRGFLPEIIPHFVLVVPPCVSADDGKLSLDEFQAFFSDGTLNEEELEKLFHTIDSDNTRSAVARQCCVSVCRTGRGRVSANKETTIKTKKTSGLTIWEINACACIFSLKKKKKKEEKRSKRV